MLLQVDLYRSFFKLKQINAEMTQARKVEIEKQKRDDLIKKLEEKDENTRKVLDKLAK